MYKDAAQGKRDCGIKIQSLSRSSEVEVLVKLILFSLLIRLCALWLVRDEARDLMLLPIDSFDDAVALHCALRIRKQKGEIFISH